MRILPLALLFVLTGCDAILGSDGVSLDTDRKEYARGATATLTLRNDSDKTVSMSPLSCARRDRRVGGLWTQGNARGCPRILVNVPAGEEYMERVALEDFHPGTYRLVQGTSIEDAVSRSFEVQ